MGGSCVDRFPHLRNPDGQRKRNAMKLKALKQRQLQSSNARRDEVCQTVSAIKPCKHFANGKGVCPFGSKCLYSHAIIKPKPITSGPKVAAEIYFKSLPVDAMSEQDMRQMADQWGTHCTGVRFIGDGRNPMCPGRIAGKVFMDNEAAAWSFLEELDNKLFIVESKHGKQRVYVKAKMEKLEKLTQPITAKAVSMEAAATMNKSGFSSNFLQLSDKARGKQTVAKQVQYDHDFALMMQQKYEFISNKSAKEEVVRFRLAVFDWPSLPVTSAKVAEEVQPEIQPKAPTKPSSKDWQTVTLSRKHRSIYSVLQADSSDEESTPESEVSDKPVPAEPTPTPVEPTPTPIKLDMPTEPTTPLVKKQLKLLDWFEFERERLEQRAKDKMAKTAWSTMMENKVKSDDEDDDTSYIPNDETALQPENYHQEEDDEVFDSDDDDDNSYFDEDDSKNVERLKWLLPAKYRLRFS